MKKLFGFLFSLLTIMTLASCGKAKLDQDKVYEDIVDLCDGYETNSVSYTSVLYSESMNLTLTNSGSLTKDKDVYTYVYSYQYLNKIGSGASELVSTETGTITGTKDEITTEGFEVGDASVVSLNLKDSFKTHKITQSGESYLMKGYIARNTIIKNTDDLDDDIRFNYELTVNEEVTKIESLVISYVTVRFDSVVITITF